MPDHLHQIWVGLHSSSNQHLASRFFRKHFNATLHPFRLQLQSCDRVLRQRERTGDAFNAVCSYILQNPVRAGLCPHRRDYPYSNALVAGYPDLDARQPDFWESFWKIYNRLVAA